ncbi:DoxX family protein [Nocardia amamiensis]|uniref:DoxX family protein n=1 Tax=Nocardia amamiensis TaxID=404578 RepID=UPI00082A6E85|nr:DoxX family protein [Nocardia amamiensis]
MTTVLTVAVGLLFFVTGMVKLVGLRQSLEIRDHLRVSPALWRLTGALEVAGALGALIGIYFRPLGVAALAGLTALMVGAIVARLRVRDTVTAVIADIVVLALVVATLALNAFT